MDASSACLTLSFNVMQNHEKAPKPALDSLFLSVPLPMDSKPAAWTQPLELDPSIDLDLSLPDCSITVLPWTLSPWTFSFYVFLSSVLDPFVAQLPDKYTNLLFASPLDLDCWLALVGSVD